jgi:N-acyl-L-homoserine lactone synthetase
MEMLIKKVISDEELDEVFRLRYRVYCLERGYERPEDHPGEVETDMYDPFSVHFIAYVRSAPVGTVRLVLQNPFGFPLERFCKLEAASICGDTGRVAEISRLAVSSEAVRNGLAGRSRITLGLLNQLHFTARELNIECFLTAMSSSLERLLNRCGMMFRKAGPSVDYHGIRTPYYAYHDELEKEVFYKRKDIFARVFQPDASLSALDNLVQCEAP